MAQNSADNTGPLVLAFLGLVVVDKVAGLFGPSQDEKDGKRRSLYPMLYDRTVTIGAGTLPDATLADLDVEETRTAALGRMAAVIYDAPGLVNDNEGALVSAFAGLQTLYDLLWLNKTFSYLFTTPSVAPTIGEYLDGFLSDEEWGPLVRILDRLPKYPTH